MTTPDTVRNLPDAAMRAAVLKALLDEIKKAYDAARAEADAALLHLHTGVGVRTVEVRLPGSAAPIAQISVQDTHDELRVDEAAMVAYCLAEHPSEVEEVPAQHHVRAAFRKVLLARLTVEPDGTVVDPTTGRVVDFATRVPAAAPARTTLTFKTGGRERVAAGHRDGQLPLPHLLAPQVSQ